MRTMLEHMRVLKVQDRLRKHQPGHFWYSTTKKEADAVNFAPLGSTRCNTVVVEVLDSCEPRYQTRRHEEQDETKVNLAGHFMRGNAGSVAYYLAVKHGAMWDPMVAVDRARHTLNSFFNSYARGVIPRLAAAFDKHPNKLQLRFESASRL